MKLSLFDYDLPDELIAQVPARPRDKCRLMHVDRSKGSIKHLNFFDLPRLLRNGDVLVLNNSRVIPARIRLSAYHKNAEILLIRHLNGSKWLVLGKPGKLLRCGNKIFVNERLFFYVDSIDEFGQRIIKFNLLGRKLAFELEKVGLTPLPPYISGKQDHAKTDYQTVYAKKNGSVAAPTAGLHFTRRILKKIANQGVKIVEVTLHVGPGTFTPVKSDDIRQHTMHSEWFSLGARTAKVLNEARARNNRIIAVGTTSVRVLESAFEEKNGFKKMSGETSIFIYPGYKWKCVDGIITNFHLPKSTLIMLVSAFVGRDTVMRAYREAVTEKYRFFSYGDAMILI